MRAWNSMKHFDLQRNWVGGVGVNLESSFGLESHIQYWHSAFASK